MKIKAKVIKTIYELTEGQDVVVINVGRTQSDYDGYESVATVIDQDGKPHEIETEYLRFFVGSDDIGTHDYLDYIRKEFDTIIKEVVKADIDDVIEDSFMDGSGAVPEIEGLLPAYVGHGAVSNGVLIGLKRSKEARLLLMRVLTEGATVALRADILAYLNRQL